MFNTVDISSYTTCHNLKSPFLAWVVLGWIVHLAMYVIVTKTCKILETKAKVHYKRMRFGRALKKNRRTEYFRERYDTHFVNSKRSLTKDPLNFYQANDIWNRSSTEFGEEICHPPLNSTHSKFSPDSSVSSSSHFGRLSSPTKNRNEDIEANWDEPLLLKNNSDFDKISRDSLGIIISYFDSKSLARSEGISRDWYKLSTQHKYWKNFPGDRTYTKKIVQGPPNRIFWRIILALILVICLLEFTVQYGIFIVRIRENLPVGSLPQGSPCATDVVCSYPVCEDGICQEFRGEGECVLDNVNEIDPEKCCSLETCQVTDDDNDPVGPSYCCRSTGTWRSYSCWTMAYIFSFNAMSIVTTSYISIKVLDTHFQKQSAQIFFYSNIFILLLLTLGGHALCISTFFTHMLPGIILYIWIAIILCAPVAFVMWCMQSYLPLKQENDNYMYMLLLFIAFQLLELIVTPMAEYFFLGVSYTDSVATVMNEMTDTGNILEEMLIFVL